MLLKFFTVAKANVVDAVGGSVCSVDGGGGISVIVIALDFLSILSSVHCQSLSSFRF